MATAQQFGHIKDILQAYKDGKIARSELIDQLVNFPFDPLDRLKTKPDAPYDPASTEGEMYDQPDTPDEIRKAVYSGIITRDIYHDFVKRMNVQPQFPTS